MIVFENCKTNDHRTDDLSCGGFEYVCTASCTISNIIPNQICNNRRVSRIVFRNTSLNFSNKIGTDILVLKVAELTTLADYFVIATGRNVQAVHALYEEVTDKLLEEEDLTFRRNDGVRESRWIVIDYANVIVPEDGAYAEGRSHSGRGATETNRKGK